MFPYNDQEQTTRKKAYTQTDSLEGVAGPGAEYAVYDSVVKSAGRCKSMAYACSFLPKSAGNEMGGYFFAKKWIFPHKMKRK